MKTMRVRSKAAASMIFAMLAVGPLALTAEVAGAVPIPNPSPAALQDDIDGSGYFTPGATMFAVESYDVGELLGVQPLTFGFYFAGTDTSNPSNLIPVFEPDDLINDEAVVNFGLGIVVDVDQGAVQSTFSGSGNIGFYLTLNAFGGGTLFSDPLLNGGTDYFGTLPFIADSTRYALVFHDLATDALISLVVVNGLSPVPFEVSEPGTLGLIALGMLGAVRLNPLRGRKRGRFAA